MRRVRVSVTGRVQGVFYRATCAQHADRLGIAGWIRNVGDDAVEAAFEGPDEAIREIVEWCREGPPAARVDRVDVRSETPRGERGFHVDR